jgi:hypothetical protein
LANWALLGLHGPHEVAIGEDHGARLLMHVKDIQRSAKFNYGFDQETMEVDQRPDTLP